jgi:hypothetical protein
MVASGLGMKLKSISVKLLIAAATLLLTFAENAWATNKGWNLLAVHKILP